MQTIKDILTKNGLIDYNGLDGKKYDLLTRNGIIKKNMSQFGSFAVYNDEPPYLSTKMFEEKFNPNYVLIFLNLSREISGNWGNFHEDRSINPHTHDHIIKKIISMHSKKLRGCYITDLVKSYIESEGTKVIDLLLDQENGREIREASFKILKMELEDLSIDKTNCKFIFFYSGLKKCFEKEWFLKEFCEMVDLNLTFEGENKNAVITWNHAARNNETTVIAKICKDLKELSKIDFQ